MFALEINFNDGVSPPEIVLVRRPHAIVGSSEFAHVVIEGAPSIPCELRISRGLGRQFQCHPLKKSGAAQNGIALPEGSFVGSAQLNLGSVVTNVTALDIDLLMAPQESPDRAGVRVLRSALSQPTPLFPAVAVLGAVPVFVSFLPSDPIIIGRSRKCGLRLDSSGISSEHARMGFEHDAFWVEDLGSTNGTFVNGERVSGRRVLGPEDTIVLGNEFVLAGIRSESDLEQLDQRVTPPTATLEDEHYPCLVTVSELARPSRVVLVLGRNVGIGRDPANDIWVGAAHISRTHCHVALLEDGTLRVVDQSTNGTYVNGERLTRGDAVFVDPHGSLVDLKEGVVFTACSSEEEEREFIAKASDRKRNDRDDASAGPHVLETRGGDRPPAKLESWESTRKGPERREDFTGNPSVFQAMARREGNAVSGDDDSSEERLSPADTAAALTSKFTPVDLEAEGSVLAEDNRIGRAKGFGIVLVVAGLVAIGLLIIGLIGKT